MTSNPSPAYVAAVTAVFNNPGGRGDLAAVVRAILTHPEASAATATSGKLSEPVLFVVAPLRAFGATVTDHPFMSDGPSRWGRRSSSRRRCSAISRPDTECAEPPSEAGFRSADRSSRS